MEHLFLPYELAFKLKEKGFKEHCFMWWYSPTQISEDLIFRQYKSEPDFCEAPLYQQVMDWFRDKHQLFIEIQTDCTTYPKFAFEINRFIGNPNDLTKGEWDWENIKVKEWHLYRTHKEAMDYAIKEALKLI